jgi:hypothetical protein
MEQFHILRQIHVSWLCCITLCMYVHTYVCTYVCTCAYINVCMCIHMNIRMYVFMYTLHQKQLEPACIVLYMKT